MSAATQASEDFLKLLNSGGDVKTQVGIDDIKNITLTPEQQKTVSTEMSKGMDDENFRAQVMKDIDDLAKHVFAIEEDFRKIKDTVQHIDEQEILRKNGNGEVIKLCPRWSELSQTFVNLRQASQTTANTALAQVDFFVDLIPKVSTASNNFTLDQKIKSAEKFHQKLVPFVANAEKAEKDFLDLQANVASFRTTLVEAIKVNTEQSAEKIKNLEGEIKDLEQKLKDASGFFAGCWNTLKAAGPNLVKTTGALGAVGGSAAMAGVLTIAPVAAVGLLAVGFGAIGYSLFSGFKQRQADLEGLRKQLVDKRAELGRERARQEKLQKAMVEVEQLGPTFEDLCHRLSIIAGIWRLLVVDAQRLAGLLKDIKDNGNDPDYDPIAMDIFFDNLTPAYKTLKVSLDKYALSSKAYMPK
ncbi:hypothetical protein BJ165DRAFT_1497092 [Panaeolus papilionaceus]|nr:hypothetical protein BJ165DRAFT_1497092 [Panaeolus papilionaceus]